MLLVVKSTPSMSFPLGVTGRSRQAMRKSEKDLLAEVTWYGLAEFSASEKALNRRE